MSDYDFKSSEDKWQTRWTESDIYRSVIDKSKPKHYAVTMLPSPRAIFTSVTGTRWPRQMFEPVG